NKPVGFFLRSRKTDIAKLALLFLALLFKDAIFTAIPKKLLKDYKQLPLILEINDKIDRMSICPDLEMSC
ncbi:MAG: hypothetical protein ACK400_14700, partial [Pseudanabaena sp.]